jgi:hypothetical protein
MSEAPDPGDFDAPDHQAAASAVRRLVEDNYPDLEAHSTPGGSVSLWVRDDADVPWLMDGDVINTAIDAGATVDYVDSGGDNVSVSLSFERDTADPSAIGGGD